MSLRHLCRITTLLWKTCFLYEIIFSFHAVHSSSERVFLFVLPTVCTAPSVWIISDILLSLGNLGSWLDVSENRQILTHLFYVVIKTGNLEETKLRAIIVQCAFLSFYFAMSSVFILSWETDLYCTCLHPRNEGNSVFTYSCFISLQAVFFLMFGKKDGNRKKQDGIIVQLYTWVASVLMPLLWTLICYISNVPLCLSTKWDDWVTVMICSHSTVRNKTCKGLSSNSSTNTVSDTKRRFSCFILIIIKFFPLRLFMFIITGIQYVTTYCQASCQCADVTAPGDVGTLVPLRHIPLVYSSARQSKFRDNNLFLIAEFFDV